MQGIPQDWIDAGLDPDAAAIVVAPDVGDDWDEIRDVLLAAFATSRRAATDSRPMVFVVHNDDLLGRRGPGRAMVATGLLSGARTAAIELAKERVPVNTLAITDDSDPGTIVRWIEVLASSAGPTGELVHLGADHIGRALP